MHSPTDTEVRQFLGRHLDTPGVDARIIALAAEFDLDPDQVIRVLRGGLEHDAEAVAALVGREVSHIQRLAKTLNIGQLVAPRKRRFSARDVDRLEAWLRDNGRTRQEARQ